VQSELTSRVGRRVSARVHLVDRDLGNGSLTRAAQSTTIVKVYFLLCIGSELLISSTHLVFDSQWHNLIHLGSIEQAGVTINERARVVHAAPPVVQGLMSSLIRTLPISAHLSLSIQIGVD